MRVAKEMALGILLHEPRDNLHCSADEINDASHSLALDLDRRNQIAMIRHVDVPRFDDKRFLRATAGLPGDDQGISQRVGRTRERRPSGRGPD